MRPSAPRCHRLLRRVRALRPCAACRQSHRRQAISARQTPARA